MYLMVILLGFALIGVGTVMWFETHIVEKWQEGMSTDTFYDAEGNVQYQQFNESFFKKYKIVKK